MPRVAPYTASLYRRGSAPASAYREQRAPWQAPHATDVECDLQLARGDVEPTPAGQEAGASHNAWFDTGTDLVPGDGVEITAGPNLVGERFTVANAHDWGAPGDLEAELKRTTEAFS